MKKGNSFYDIVEQMVSHGVRKGMLHLYNEEENFSGNQLVLKGKKVINFGSCSYLGLEFDPRLKEGAKRAIDAYGTQFSESRAYVSLRLYRELETLLNQIFEANCVVTPTTTLGHIAAIPVLVNDHDVVLIDQQVHHSIQTAVDLVKARGVRVEVIRHNRIDLLEERLNALYPAYDKVWYMADGIYSMFGDHCPVSEIHKLLEKYTHFHFYVDDAHGMSIYGKHGRGFVLQHIPLHPRMILAASLNKAFASGGGVLVFPGVDLANKVRSCGGPMITSGPMQPGALGAAVACAKIHLSAEITDLQTELQDKIKYTRTLISRLALPLISTSDGAVFYVGIGLPKAGYRLIEKMLDAGYYLNLGIFPAVPMKQTGVRFTITRLHKFAQIDAMIYQLHQAFREVVREENIFVPDIYRAFKLPVPEESKIELTINTALQQSLSLTCAHVKSIREVDHTLWDELFKDKGSFDWQGCDALETSFSCQKKPEDHWEFDYFIMKDAGEKVVAATFCTTTLWKDDMLSPATISEQAELKRKSEPYFLTTLVTATGSLLSEGEHVYINKKSPLWQAALRLLLEKMTSLQRRYGSASLVLRDFTKPDAELDDLMVDNGYFKFSLPETYRIDPLVFPSPEEFYRQLSKRSRQHFREEIKKYSSFFEVTVITGQTVDEDIIDQWYQLYLQVKDHNLTLNTFALPRSLFSSLLTNKNWEVLWLHLHVPGSVPLSAAMVYCYRSGDAYIPLFIGLDYSLNREYGIYRQALYRIVCRAAESGMKKVLLGFSAGTEKKKLGAHPTPVHGYMQTKEDYQHKVLTNLFATGSIDTSAKQS